LVIQEQQEKLIGIYFKITPEHKKLIHEKMKCANIRNMSAYIRKMALDGYIVRLDLGDVRKMVQLLSNSSNSLNQIAKRVNADGSIFASDIKDMQDKYEGLWDQTEAILRGLAKVPR